MATTKKDKPAAAEPSDFTAIAGTVYFNYLQQPDTKYNKAGSFSVLMTDLSQKAEAFMETAGINPKQLDSDGSMGYKFMSSFAPKLYLGKDSMDESQPFDEKSPFIGRGSKAIVVGRVFEHEKGNTFKIFKVVITDLVPYVPTGDAPSGLEPL